MGSGQKLCTKKGTLWDAHPNAAHSYSCNLQFRCVLFTSWPLGGGHLPQRKSSASYHQQGSDHHNSGSVPNDTLFPYVVHHFWPGLTSKLEHYIGNRVAFGIFTLNLLWQRRQRTRHTITVGFFKNKNSSSKTVQWGIDHNKEMCLKIIHIVYRAKQWTGYTITIKRYIWIDSNKVNLWILLLWLQNNGIDHTWYKMVTSPFKAVQLFS